MLTVMVITKNEEANLQRCLQSVAWADEIVVVDSGSTDSTLDIAKQFTENVVVHNDWQGYGVQKQRALDRATGTWVLNLDADEMVTEPLKEAILAAMAADDADAYRVPINMVFYGKVLRYSSCPKRHVRLFKREGASFSNDLVHEKIVLPKEARIRKLSGGSIRHYSFRDLSHALTKINRYSSYSAHIRMQSKAPPPFLWVLMSTGWMFYRCFILQGGFLDGKEGLIMAALNATGTYFRGVKQLYRDMKPKRAVVKPTTSLPKGKDIESDS